MILMKKLTKEFRYFIYLETFNHQIPIFGRKINVVLTSEDDHLVIEVCIEMLIQLFGE